MQPNQQDPSNQTGVTPPSAPTPIQPPPYQVPEYLGLEPIVITPRPKKRRLRFVIVVSTILFLALIFIIATYFINRSDPESRFYSAIDKLLETGPINRDGTVVQAKVASASYRARSDFSIKSTPKSAIAYNYSPLSEDANRKIEGDIVETNSLTYYARITTFPTILSAQGLTANQWYAVSSSVDSSSVSFVDNLNLHSQVNSSFGAFIIANLNVDERSRLISLMKIKGMYSIDKVYKDKVDDVPATAFAISVSQSAVLDVNRELSKIIDVQLPYPYNAAPILNNAPKMTYIVWISDQDSRIIKTNEQHKSGDSQVETSILYSYPASVAISAPDADNIKQLAPRK